MQQTANDEGGVIYLTLSMDGAPSEAQREALDVVLSASGGSAIWRSNTGVARTYALLQLPAPRDRSLFAVPPNAVLYETPIIALAVFPALAEALPRVAEAVAGPGRPAALAAHFTVAGAIVVEWDPAKSPVALLTDLIDVELARFQCGRRTELLSPLPAALVTQIAAEGVRAPQIVTHRVLELQMRSEGV